MKSTGEHRPNGRARNASWRFSIPDVTPPGVICVNGSKYYPGKVQSHESNGIRGDFKKEKHKLIIRTKEDIRMIELNGKVIPVSSARDVRGTKYLISHFEEVDALVGQNMSKWDAIKNVALDRSHEADSFGRAWRRYRNKKKCGR